MVFKRYLNKACNILLFVLFFIFVDILQTHCLFPDMWLPTYAILDILLVFGLGCVCLIFRSNLFDMIYMPIIYIVIVVFMNVGVTFNNTVGDVFSLANLALASTAGNVAGSATSFHVMFLCVSILLCVLFVGSLVGTYFLFRIKDKDGFKTAYRKKVWRKYLISASVTVCALSGYAVSLINVAKKNNTIDTIMMEKLANFRNYGMLSYYAQEIPYLLNGINTNKNTDAKLKEYFDVYKDVKNDYTGLLKDYNVVNIMIETGDDLMMNPHVCPNLYAMIEDGGINCANNVSKNKTNMSEFIGFTGSAPISGFLPGHKYNIPFNAPALLQQKDYTTMFFHDVPKEMDTYNRNGIMPQLNFDECYFREQMFGEDAPSWNFDGSFSQDKDCMPVVADKILEHKEEKFYAFYTTLSMHGPYVSPKNQPKLEKEYGAKYDQMVADGLFVNPLVDTVNEQCVKNYIMATMNFDEGLGILVDKFKNTVNSKGENMYDKTLFVLYGDHEIYYKGANGISLNRQLANPGTIYKDMNHPDMYQTSLIFVNKQLKDKYVAETGKNEYETFTSTYNICPTVLDLLGVNYNPNYYIGHSLFNKAEMSKVQVHYSIEQSGFFNKDFWSIQHGSVYRIFNPAADKEAFINEVNRVMEKASLLDIIYSNDYFVTHDFKEYNTNYENK